VASMDRMKGCWFRKVTESERWVLNVESSGVFTGAVGRSWIRLTADTLEKRMSTRQGIVGYIDMKTNLDRCPMERGKERGLQGSLL
jgi:hypothetical protein